jgi:hypothetical protein
MEAAGLVPKAPPPPKPVAVEDAPEVVAAKVAAKAAERCAELQRDAAKAQPAPIFHLHAGATHITTPEVRNDITVHRRCRRARDPQRYTVQAAAAPSVEVKVEALMPEQPAPQIDVHVELPDELRIASLPAPPPPPPTRAQRCRRYCRIHADRKRCNETSPRGIDFVKEFEGVELTPIICSAGKKTIGVGHVIRPTDVIPIPSPKQRPTSCWPTI